LPLPFGPTRPTFNSRGQHEAEVGEEAARRASVSSPCSAGTSVAGTSRATFSSSTSPLGLALRGVESMPAVLEAVRASAAANWVIMALAVSMRAFDLVCSAPWAAAEPLDLGAHAIAQRFPAGGFGIRDRPASLQETG